VLVYKIFKKATKVRPIAISKLPVFVFSYRTYTSTLILHVMANYKMFIAGTGDELFSGIDIDDLE